MRVLLASLVFVGTLFGSYEDEPNERQMLSAFEGTLALNVRNALDFIVRGRHIINEQFVSSTTPKAHQIWRRIK